MFHRPALTYIHWPFTNTRCRAIERDPQGETVASHLRQLWQHRQRPGLRHGLAGCRNVRHLSILSFIKKDSYPIPKQIKQSNRLIGGRKLTARFAHFAATLVCPARAPFCRVSTWTCGRSESASGTVAACPDEITILLLQKRQYNFSFCACVVVKEKT